MDITRLPIEEQLRREIAFNITSNKMNSTFLHALNVIRDHFTDDWMLKGDGKWRFNEIVKQLRRMDEAGKEALADDNAITGD